jgi:hypothetical protein
VSLLGLKDMGKKMILIAGGIIMIAFFAVRALQDNIGIFLFLSFLPSLSMLITLHIFL